MAITRQQIILEVDAETGEVLKATSDLQKNMEGVADAANDAAEATESIGTAGADAGSKLKKAGQTGTSAFKGLGAAIKATGIGLLVALLAKLVVAFTENKKVADALGVATAALGVVFNDLIEFGQLVGEKLFEAFSNPKQAILDFATLVKENIVNRIVGLLELFPKLAEAASLAFELKFAEAGKVATDAVAKVALGVEDFSDKLGEATTAVVEYAQGTTEAVTQATALERQLQALSDAERDLAVTTAQSTAQVEELKRQRDDERLSIEERIAAAEEAAAIDQAIADENVRIQEQKAALLRRELELQGETEERLQAVADAEIAAADARAASAAVQTELQTSIFGLNAEAEAQRQEQEDAEIERQKAELERRKELAEALASEQELELTKLREDYEAKLALAREFGEGEAQLTEEFEAKKAEIEKNYAEKNEETKKQEAENEKAAAEQRVAIQLQTLGALQGLASAFAKDTEKSQRKAFEVNKALQIAQATIQTYQSATAAYASQLTIPTPDAPIRAAIAAGAAVASGLAQIAVISKTKFQGGAPASTPKPSTGGLGGVSTPTGAGGGTQPPQLDLGFLGEGAGQEGPIQAYVVSENVSNAQQANQKIKEQAAL